MQSAGRQLAAKALPRAIQCRRAAAIDTKALQIMTESLLPQRYFEMAVWILSTTAS